MDCRRVSCQILRGLFKVDRMNLVGGFPKILIPNYS